MTNTEKADVLKKVLALLDGGNNWIKWHDAVDASGSGVKATSPSAAKWCVLGCGNKVMEADLGWTDYPKRDLVYAELEAHPLVSLGRNRGSLPHFNDSASWPDVERVLTDTIARLEAA